LFGKPGTHTRSILFLKHNYWIMRDRVHLLGKHQIDVWFHFDSEVAPNLLQIVSFVENGAWAEEEGWVSRCYADRRPAPVRVFSVTASGAIEITTFLLPSAAAGGKTAHVKPSEVSGGRGFEIRMGDRRDVLVMRDCRTALAQTPSLVSDFDCAWLRFSGSNSTPEELLVLGGQRLELTGNKIISSAERIEYSWLTRHAHDGTYVRN
jgi:hypothetical protein